MQTIKKRMEKNKRKRKKKRKRKRKRSKKSTPIYLNSLLLEVMTLNKRLDLS